MENLISNCTNMTNLILASTSPTRQTLMQNAGFDVKIFSPQIDERQIETQIMAQWPNARITRQRAATLALELASQKALNCSRNIKNDVLVIGADQIALFDGQFLHKPGSIEQTRTQLRSMRGKTHHQLSAIALAQDSQVIWQHVEIVALTFADFSDQELDVVIELDGDQMQHCAGGYRIEGPALRLFDRIEGDYFAILGLPVLPLLKAIRERGIVT